MYINTGDNLSGAMGQTLTGVHTFETLAVAGRAKVDFGEDRVVVLDASDSDIATNTELYFGDMPQATIEG